MIHELKKNIGIPVIGNWDVIDYDDGIKKVKDLDGFMIGRKSFGNPWCFLPWGYIPTLNERIDIMKEHARLLIELKWRKWILESRKHMVQYLHSFPWVKNYRSELVRVESIEDVVNILDKIKSDNL